MVVINKFSDSRLLISLFRLDTFVVSYSEFRSLSASIFRLGMKILVNGESRSVLLASEPVKVKRRKQSSAGNLFRASAVFPNILWLRITHPGRRENKSRGTGVILQYSSGGMGFWVHIMWVRAFR